MSYKMYIPLMENFIMQKNLKKQCLKPFYAISECFYVMHVISLSLLPGQGVFAVVLLMKSGVGITVLQFLLPPQVSVTVKVDFPPPRSPFTAGCVMTVIPTPYHNGIYCGHLLFHQSSVTLNWMGRKAIKPHCSLCQSSLALFFLLVAAWPYPFTPPTNPKTAVEISSRPA